MCSEWRTKALWLVHLVCKEQERHHTCQTGLPLGCHHPREGESSFCPFIHSFRCFWASLFLVVCLVTQSCPTLCEPIDCSPLGSFVHGISQGRILEWDAISFSWEYFWPRDRTWIFYIGGQILYHLSHLGSPTSQYINRSTSKPGPRSIWSQNVIYWASFCLDKNDS